MTQRCWPDHMLELCMLEDCAMMESEYEPTSTGHDMACHVKALLSRVHDLKMEVDRLMPFYDAIASMAGQFLCPKTTPEQLMQQILAGEKDVERGAR